MFINLIYFIINLNKLIDICKILNIKVNKEFGFDC